MSLSIHPSFIASAIAEAVIKHKAEMIDGLCLVSISEAARMLDVTPATARKLLKKGVDVGGKGMKVKLSEVQQIIAERTVKL